MIFCEPKGPIPYPQVILDNLNHPVLKG